MRLYRFLTFRSSCFTSRNISHDSGLTTTTVFRILTKQLNFRPWRPIRCQELSDNDCEVRQAYADRMLQWHQEWTQLFENIIWSDEAVFHINGFVRLRNCFFWAKDNPKVLFPKSQNRQKLTVWCGFTATQVIGPVIMRDTMNAERYLRMLTDQVWPFVNDQDNLIFMQDGAPAHYATVVREWLDEHFPGRWLGRRGPHEWPPRSPDITPWAFIYGGG